MIKKFLLYFAIFFVVTFIFLNFSSMTAELRYWLDSPGRTQAKEISTTASQIAGNSSSLPVSKQSAIPTISVNPADGFQIYISKIGITAPIVIESNPDPKVIYKDLKKGVVHYSGSAMFGQPGTAMILGHSWTTSWRPGNYDSVFSLINKLEVGDTFIIRNGSKELVYRVSGSLVFHPLSKDKKIEEFIKSNGSSVVLITCWPAGTSLNRLAVKADLIN